MYINSRKYICFSMYIKDAYALYFVKRYHFSAIVYKQFLKQKRENGDTFLYCSGITK